MNFHQQQQQQRLLRCNISTALMPQLRHTPLEKRPFI
jgi:hypothetical protein